MKGMWSRVGMVVGALVITPGIGTAAEHGGKEHAGMSTPGPTAAAPETPAPTQAAPAVTPPAAEPAVSTPVEPTAEQIRQTIRDYIAEVQQEEGAFTIEDEVTGKTRTLTLDHVHDRVGKTGEYYYSCTDMKDQESGDTLDLDFDVEAYEGDLEVVDVRIHKVNDQPRYTYDDKDNRVPVTPAAAPAAETPSASSPN